MQYESDAPAHRSSHPRPADSGAAANRGSDQNFVLLNDQPVGDPSGDLLGMGDVAEGIASMLISSCVSSPFVLAVDAGWGMGKSTLLHQIESRIAGHRHITTLRFNAWTAEGENALEGLIKSVLGELDRNVVRRWARRLTQRRRLLGVAWLGSALIGRFLGAARLVDEVWKQLAVDAKSRNELRDVIHAMLTDWVMRDGQREPERGLVVFIDDLDRCTDEVVVRVCEAIKLYLDAPGLIFVLACDQSVLARGVSASARGGQDEGRSYLEKIVQVVYRVPPPEDTQVKRLIRGYAQQSRTTELIDMQVTRILAERTGRNPRKIKRIINSFVLEYQLDPAWRKAPLGSTQLVTAILLQHLYTSFYDLLIRDDPGEDPIGELLDYAEVREKASDPPSDDEDPFWDTAKRTFQEHHLAWHPNPDRTVAIEQLERKLPEVFPALADRNALIALLRGLGSKEVRLALCAQLIRRPLATEVSQQEPPPVPAPVKGFAGLRIVCLDDNPASLDDLVTRFEDLGASVKVYADPIEADREFRRRRPDAVISDITRGEDPVAGFEHIARLRASGYDGPVVFFTGRVTPERRERATELGALDIVTDERAVISALREIAQFPPLSQ